MTARKPCQTKTERTVFDIIVIGLNVFCILVNLYVTKMLLLFLN